MAQKSKFELVREVYAADPGFNRSEFARGLGCSPSYVHKCLRAIKAVESEVGEEGGIEEIIDDIKVNRDIKGDEQYIHINSMLVNTLKDALRVAKIDLDVWGVDRHTISSSQVTMKIKEQNGEDKNGNPIMVDRVDTRANWHVKIWLKRRPERHAISAIQKLVKTLPTFKYSKFNPVNIHSDSKYAGIMALIDAHLGKFAWGEELNGRDYDLKIARDDYIFTTKENLAYMAPFKPEIIYYILGQDLMHTENYEGTTTKGKNVLDVDNRLPKIIYRAKEIVLKSIMECRKLAPVEVIWVPGNHDMYSSLWMAHIIDAFFSNDKHVTVDMGPAVRKARLWGNTLIGWTHTLVGRHQAWANELAQSFPVEWSKSIHREWHHGHKHKKGEVKTFPIVTQGGVLMRQLTALSPIDFWHYDNLFTDAVPGGEAFIMHQTKGVVANFTAWTDHTHTK